MIFKSIRWRLQIWYGLILMVVLAGFGFTSYQLECGRQFRRIDEELQRRVGMLASVMRQPPGQRGLEHLLRADASVAGGHLLGLRHAGSTLPRSLRRDRERRGQVGPMRSPAPRRGRSASIRPPLVFVFVQFVRCSTKATRTLFTTFSGHATAISSRVPPIFPPQCLDRSTRDRLRILRVLLTRDSILNRPRREAHFAKLSLSHRRVKSSWPAVRSPRNCGTFVSRRGGWRRWVAACCCSVSRAAGGLPRAPSGPSKASVPRPQNRAGDLSQRISAADTENELGRLAAS